MEFELMLTRFALERLLYRLGISQYRDQFLLKGALLFDLWYDEPHRPTRDADFLGFGPADIPHIVGIFREVCALPGNDELSFDPDSVNGQEIRKEAAYAGIRILFTASLSGAVIPLQADIGFGDAVTPAPEETDYPTIISELPAPKLRVYPRYTVVAEKYEAIVKLGMANSRMKDFFDLWILTRTSELDASVLEQAIQATFQRRGTALPTSTPLGLSEQFVTDATKLAQWKGFVSKNRLEAPSLAEVVTHLREFFLT
jgi:hypothetical protein